MVWACIKINFEGHKKNLQFLLGGFLFLLGDFRDAFWMIVDEQLYKLGTHFKDFDLF